METDLHVAAVVCRVVKIGERHREGELHSIVVHAAITQFSFGSIVSSIGEVSRGSTIGTLIEESKGTDV